MISKHAFSTRVVPKSITNPLIDAADTLDNTAPFSFLEFIKNTNEDYSPEEYNDYYIQYLKSWSEVKEIKRENIQASYIENYVEFLKELVINFATQQEIKFLQKINFSDPVDLDVAIPFFTEKIRQVILFYKNQRNEGKYIIDRNKIKGTEYSLQKAIFEKIYTYLFSIDNEPTLSMLNYNLSGIINNLQINVEEFVDVYANYFDLPRNEQSTDELRRELYTSNLIEPNSDLYLKGVDEILASEAFLTEIPLAINNANNQLGLQVQCSDLNPIFRSAIPETDEEPEEEVPCDITPEGKINLQKKIIEKYIGVDLYYYDKTTSPPTSGLLIKATNPYANIQNIQTADIAAIPSNQTKLLRDIGLFFKPDKLGLFKLYANNYTYKLDPDQTLENKLYIFPDPAIYGNASLNYKKDYPVVFEYDFRKDTKNVSSGFASGDPLVKSNEQTFSPYYSKQQSESRDFISDDSLYLNFADLFNKGYIVKYQTDIFGNEYALFKDEFGHNFKDIEVRTASYIKNLLLNGHVFYDPLEGYNFDYSVVGIDATTIRSGLTTKTADQSPANFNLSSALPYHLYFREFTPYQELNTENNLGTLFNLGFTPFATTISSYNPEFYRRVSLQDVVIFKRRDCGQFTYFDDSTLPNPSNSQFNDFPVPGIYFYDTVLEAGVTSLYPLSTPGYPTLLDDDVREIILENGQELALDLQEGNFTLDIKAILSATGGYYDCRYFTDTLIEEGEEPVNPIVAEGSMTLLSQLEGSDILKSQYEKEMLEGKIFVKNQQFSSSLPLSSALSKTFSKYSSSIKEQIYNNPLNIDVIYDSIFIETKDYLVVDKILYDDNEFQIPKTANTYFAKDTFINTFSNFFLKETEHSIIFCMLDTIGSLSASNNKPIYPVIYNYNIKANKVTKLFPKNTTELAAASSIFTLSDYNNNKYNVNLIRTDSPKLTYNSFNDIYKLTYTCVDNNNLFHLFDYEFDIDEIDVHFYNNKYYAHSKALTTSNFSSNKALFLQVYSLSGEYTVDETTGVLSL